MENKICYNGNVATLEGKNVIKKETKLFSLQNIFQDQVALEQMDPDQVVYEVEMHDNGLKEGEKGGLFFGISHIHPGKVGNEYFMTRGHIHLVEDTGEYYWGLEGEGLLILTFPDGKTYVEEVRPNSLHYIPGKVAHRLVNTGQERLSVGACWLTESGHNYNKKGLFKVSVVEEVNQFKVLDLEKFK
ncbi:glucose-6-phosphate isomerase family protein [Granulicatella seriolae]|uniref:glucose-6-phosphate isomerase n=1 Tax=Granulicatella seriolae TaxID=2967226 RepID=A0ABT1WMD5_9LACT|nr:glucose-6-phosphate isomerase family protein [Granulicatella seriolae]